MLGVVTIISSVVTTTCLNPHELNIAEYGPEPKVPYVILYLKKILYLNSHSCN